MENENEWIKPCEYSFTNAAGEVFHEIAYSRQDVNTFAKMHKAIKYGLTEWQITAYGTSFQDGRPTKL
jgi:hypothetical protein